MMFKLRLITSFFVFLISLFSCFSQGEDEFFGKLRTVVIDAGHGGDDVGCIGSNSHEKDIALAISLKLGKYLEERFQHLNVIYTRKEDVFVNLNQRAKIANRAKADLFICIHANSASSSAFGTETFVMGMTKKEANLKAAQRENSAILLEENYEERYENFDPNSAESYIAMNLLQNAYQDHSINFAEKVQRQFRERVGRKDRGVKMAPFLVLHQTTMPSVLIETGFLTNLNEEKFLMSEIGQDYMASAIYRAFKEYKVELESKTENMQLEKEPLVSAEEDEISSSSAQRNTEEGLIFKVQLVTFSSEVEDLDKTFSGLNEIDYYKAGGLYRYTYGKALNLEKAAILEQEAKKQGFNDAFIVAFYNGERMAVGEATKLLKRE